MQQDHRGWALTGGGATIEVTNFCDLRCVYCYQSDSNYVRRRSSKDELDSIINQFCDLRVSHVHLTGAGEVTTHRGWVELTNALRQRGIHYSLTTNLSHDYKEDEIEALAGAAELNVSFDTHDPQLHAKIRRRSELNVILHNLLLIQRKSSQTGNKPFITNNCVVSFETLSGLELMVARASKYGIDRVALLYMIDKIRLEGDFQVSELKTPNGRIRDGVPEAIKAFRLMAEKCDVDVFISDIIADIEVEAAFSHEISLQISAEANCEDAPTGLGMTRLCVAPWRAVYVTNDRNVGPCCLLSDYLGPLAARPLSEAVHSPEMESLRSALLSGDLENSKNSAVRDVCSNCTLYPRVPVEELEALLGPPPPPTVPVLEQIINFAEHLSPKQQKILAGLVRELQLKPWRAELSDRQDFGAFSSEMFWPDTLDWRDIVFDFDEPQQFGGVVYLICELEAKRSAIMRVALISEGDTGVMEWRGEIPVGVSILRLEASEFEVGSGLPDLSRVSSVRFGERSSQMRLRTAGLVVRPDGTTFNVF